MSGMLQVGSASTKSSYALSSDFLIQSVRGSGRNLFKTYVSLGSYDVGHHGLVVRGDTEAFEVEVRFLLRHQPALEFDTYMRMLLKPMSAIEHSVRMSGEDQFTGGSFAVTSWTLETV
jgi:hypothetical protein